MWNFTGPAGRPGSRDHQDRRLGDGELGLQGPLAGLEKQRSRYRARRDVLKPALEAAGFRIDHSEGGLYLWASEGRDAWATMARLAELGILSGPGHFYGEHFPQHVRFSLTATDERIAAAAARLRAATETS